MTRINVGIFPEELCDKHLVAEYRELPRLWNFHPKSSPPDHFVLGKGHMLWCVQFPGMLYDRFVGLVNEMRFRGFTVNYPSPPEWARNGKRPNQLEIDKARVIVMDRLKERMINMKSIRYTKRK